jgi:hypothetical protein
MRIVSMTSLFITALYCTIVGVAAGLAVAGYDVLGYFFDMLMGVSDVTAVLLVAIPFLVGIAGVIGLIHFVKDVTDGCRCD